MTTITAPTGQLLIKGQITLAGVFSSDAKKRQ
jgi:hypothetical protein